ncbi:MAG: hypothetical protein ACRDP6_39005 [Actinoallomurus sp.]
MTSALEHRRRIIELITQSEHLEERMARWQLDASVSKSEIVDVQMQYQEWYVKAKSLVVDATLKERFVDMYEGGVVVRRIRPFLADPLALNDLYDSIEDKKLISRWRIPFEGTVRDSLATQRQILIEAAHEVSDTSGILEELSLYFRRLPDYLRTLKLRATEKVPAPEIAHEKELQIVVLAILRLLYDDVRDEDPGSKHAGGSSRPDFSIRDTNVIVETKMVRETQKDKDVGAELLVDWGRYPKHPDCQGILAIIYDPKQILDNPSALEMDLSQDGPGIPTRAIVIR